MILPPSIIERRILVDVPDDYGCYMYRFIDTIPQLLPWYLGIKKDKLPDHGGEIYWSSSKNEEFILLVQGDEPRFILEILEFKPRMDYEYLQIKENRMLLEVPDIKTNPTTYNLSYGIPPIGKNNLLDQDFISWFRETRKSGVWDTGTEKVSSLIKLNFIQIRDKTESSFVKEISYELKEVGGNSSEMNTVLIFEGIGGKFGFEDGSDVIAGTTHGLLGANSAKVVELRVTRVPKEVFEDKSPYFIRAAAGNDNFDENPLKYKPNYKDAARLLLSLNQAHGVEPSSELAKQQIKIVYGLKGKAIKSAVDKATTDIAMLKKSNMTWIDWDLPRHKKTLTNLIKVNETNSQLSMSLSSGMYDYRKIVEKLHTDNFHEGGLKRKKIKVFIKHPTEPAQEKWDLEVSDHRKFLKDMFPDYNIKFKELDTEEEDTTNAIKEQLELNEPI